MSDKLTEIDKAIAEIRRAENAKFKPFTRLTPGSSYSAPKPPPPIDWEYWRLMPRVDLWQAVALSVNLNPDTLKLDNAGDVFAKRLSIAESHALAGNLPLVSRFDKPRVSPVMLAEFAAWAKGLALPMPPELLAMAASEHKAAPVVTPEPTAAPVVAQSATAEAAGPLPLTTGDIAFSFDGMRWDEQGWKKPLGDKPKWLEACVVIPGQRGVSETRWNPVCIGAALERQGHVDARRVRAAFQTKPLLVPWLDAWKTYEADYLDND